MAQERLQKLLAQAGVASRRAAESLITAGRVRVNGRIVRELGSRADLHDDRVEVDGKRLVAEKPAYYLFHKPREMVTTLNDPEGRASLGEVLQQVPERVFPVGRLDYHTSGALFITNDGEMADALLHPTRHVPKAYVAKLKGSVDEKDLQALRNGVALDDGYKTGKAEVFVLREDRGNSWLSITIREGKNRQIHRMGDAIGHRVMRLSRGEFAGLSVEGLRPGELRPLSTKEIDKLKKDYLNPKRRRRANETRQRVATENAEFFDGWGQEVVEEPPQAGPSGRRGAARAPGKAPPSSRVNPAAERAVRALSETRAAPTSRSIGGARKKDERPRSGTGTKKAAPKRSVSPKKTAAKKTGVAASRANNKPAPKGAVKKASTKKAGASAGTRSKAPRKAAAPAAGRTAPRKSKRGAAAHKAVKTTGKTRKR